MAGAATGISSIAGTCRTGCTSLTGFQISGSKAGLRRRRFQKTTASKAIAPKPSPTRTVQFAQPADGCATVTCSTGEASGSAAVCDGGGSGKSSVSGAAVGAFCVVGTIAVGCAPRDGAGSGLGAGLDGAASGKVGTAAGGVTIVGCGCGSGCGCARSGSSRKSRNSGGVSGIACCAQTPRAAKIASRTAVMESARFARMNGIFP